MSLAVLADHMASKGRNGDTMLVHMAPEEVAGLHALALSHGGYMTINPQTGLPEAFSLKGLLKSALPMIAGFALGPAGFGIVSSALGAGALVGGATALATGSLQKGLMAGLGAYGGASLGAGITAAGNSAGIAAAQEAALSGLSPEQIAGRAAFEGLTEQGYKNVLMEQATKDYLAQGVKPTLMEGIKALGTDVGRGGFMSGVGGTAGLIKAGYAAAAPVLADQAVQTATSMPTGPRSTGTIRPYTFDPYTKRWTAQPTYPAIPVRTDAEPNQQEQQPPGGYNTGGIVALAGGGDTQQFATAGTYLPNYLGLNAVAAGQPEAVISKNALSGYDYAAATPQNEREKQINQIYNQVLGRQAEQEGLKYWAGTSLSVPEIQQKIQGIAQDIGVKVDPTQLATPTAAQLAAQQSILADPQAAALAAARSGIAAGMTDQQIADMVNMQYGKSFSAQNVADFMKAQGLTRPSTTSTATNVTYGGDTVTPEYVAPQPQVTLGEPFKPTPQTMEQVRTGYEQGGGSTAMPTITTLRPGEQPMTQNAVVDKLQAYLDANPNATAGEIMTWGRNNAVPEYQLRAAINERRFSMLTGGTKNAYDYLMGRGQYPTTPFVPGGGALMRPYSEVVGGTESAMRRFRPTMPPSSGERGSTTSTTQTTKTTTPSVDTLRKSFDQSIFGKTPEEKAAYYNSLLGQGYTDEQIRAAINAPLDDNWLALRAIAERLRGGKTGGATTSSAVTGGGTTTTGGGITLLGGSNTTASNTGTGVDTTRSTDASTVGGVVVGNNVIDPISGRSLGVVTANVDQGTGGIIQGDAVIDPITGKIIGYSDDAGLVGRLVNKNIGEEPAIIESRDIGGGNAGYDYDVGAGYYDDAANRDRSFYYDYAAPSRSFDDISPFARGGLADVAAMSAARGGNVQGYNLGGYSDGGRLLRGPGDGVSDSIPATIGNRKPARLADGEFVIPARIVSEIGNGSTEAGARKLYAMMDRVQRARAKTTGKGKVAKNTRAEKYLPA